MVGTTGAGWGRAYASRHRLAGAEADLRTAVSAYREAAHDEVSPALDRLSSAQGWLALAAGAGDWPGALDAVATAVDLLPRSVWRGLDRTGRERTLRADAATLGADAIAVALRAGRPELAVDLAERGRAVQWSQLLDVRSDLARLHAVAPHLADRLTDVAALLSINERPTWSGAP
ncbi:hypothetical protein ACN27F_06190 [Solwaraspora sp. WMMB335]|uniref:hypothetical protein n=1 Tax=Solwaraspora sp. WMMB335 TaxID=3404118 RepID=UPI003B9344EF